MSNDERFLKAAHSEGGRSVSVVGSTLVASAVGIRSRLSAKTIVTIIRGTTKIDSEEKAALTKAVDSIETDTTLGEKDAQDAVETIDRIREELSERPPSAKRVSRFVNYLAAISKTASEAIQECQSVRKLLSA
jgi:hypothetical protein